MADARTAAPTAARVAVPMPAQRAAEPAADLDALHEPGERAAAFARPLRPLSAAGGLPLQRKCACGGDAGLAGACQDCGRKRLHGLQARGSAPMQDDPFEREADRVADAVLAGQARGAVTDAPPLRIQRVPAPGGGDAAAAPRSVDRALASSGQPLESGLRAEMERHFGHDFSRVRVHVGGAAAGSARDVDALAYTVGDHVVFGNGAWAPQTRAGRHLLAHELTHVVQQGHAATRLQRQPAPAGTSDTLDSVFSAIRSARWVPGMQTLADAIDMIRGAIYFYNHREEHLQRLVEGIGATLQGAPDLARTRMSEALARVGGQAAVAGACVGDQLVLLLESLAQNWRDVIQSFLRDLVFVGLFERSIPAIIANLRALGNDLANGDVRAAIDHGVAIMTEVNAIAGVLFLWYALITTVIGAAAGTEVPVAGNAAGAAAGMTLAQAINIGLIASVVATEATRVGRGIDEMLRSWDDPEARTLGCRMVAEGVFSLTLTALLFYLGPGIQRIARSIISRAAAAIGSVARSLTRELAVVPGLATPGGLVVPFAGPEPMPRPTVPGGGRPPVVDPSARAPRPGTVRPPATTADPPPRTSPRTGTGPALGPASAVAPATEDPTRRVDTCRDLYHLEPGLHARWHTPRAAIGGNVTLDAVAFRLDAGRPPPGGQRTTEDSRRWARGIGLPRDDAGHAIGRRFGGTALFNQADGNIFPQDLSLNRGRMVVRDREAAELHGAGCDVCVHIQLIYATATSLRPSELVHTIIARQPGAPDFAQPSPPQPIPNP